MLREVTRSSHVHSADAHQGRAQDYGDYAPEMLRSARAQRQTGSALTQRSWTSGVCNGGQAHITGVSAGSRPRTRHSAGHGAKLSLLGILCVDSAILFMSSRLARACYIHGSDIGYCETSLYTNSEYRLAATPFCSSFLKYSACVPKYDPLPPSRDFQDGRWLNNTMTMKDAWVENYYNEVVDHRLEIEEDKTLQKKGIDEYGRRGSPVPRFTENADCQRAFKAYMCYINFPRCDDDGNSLVTCRSACENLMIACQNQKDLWRCGESEYFNGYEPEEPEYDSNGDAIYLRDFFPGQPFRDVEWTKRRQAKIVCTPSIKGASPPSLKPWGKRTLRIGTGRAAFPVAVGTCPAVMAAIGLLLATRSRWSCSPF